MKARSEPSTTAGALLSNNFPASNPKFIVPLRISAALTGGTAAAGASIIAGVTPGPLATVLAAHGTGQTVGSTNGRTNPWAPNVWYNAAQTVPTMAAQYLIVGGEETTADATVGQGFGPYDVAGMFVVPAGGFGLALGVLSGAGTSPQSQAPGRDGEKCRPSTLPDQKPLLPA